MKRNTGLQQISVSFVKGIGQHSIASLAELGIFTVFDLLEFFPSRYEDQTIRSFDEICDQETVTIAGEVVSLPIISFYGRKKSRCTFQIKADLYVIKVVLFNQNYVKNTIQLGDQVCIYGKWDSRKLAITGKFLGKDIKEGKASFQPIYSLRTIVSQKQMRKWVKYALEQYKNQIEDWLPESVRTQYKLPSKRETYQILHFPQQTHALKHGRRRMIYEELLLFQLKMQLLRKRIRESSEGVCVSVDKEEINRFIQQKVPFPLTQAQQSVLDEILTDMSSPYLLYRLLQGDVGSGKTIVALLCAYAAVRGNFQVAIMVPTEILAQQHFESFQNLLDGEDISLACLTGSTKAKDRQIILEETENGKLSILIGTHALLQERVKFCRLGLIVMDEQHRFGVEQRKILREKSSGQLPNILHMTATPIPRTLAITAFGEMDVSIINQMPSGRKPVRTRWVRQETETQVWSFLCKEVEKGHQAYVICPLIEDSEKMDLENALELYEKLKSYVNNVFEIALLHGKMKPQKKEEIMTGFKQGKTKILVSTTVIEVGVNVPNASVMVIYDAERFGLAQLHQLRGRVGRGAKQSFCILIGNPKTEMGKERLKIMEETHDGFQVAEHDLNLRGPGDFFGYKQSGLPDFKIANIIHDYRALEVARQDAVHLIDDGELWNNPEYAALLYFMEQNGYFDAQMFD